MVTVFRLILKETDAGLIRRQTKGKTSENKVEMFGKVSKNSNAISLLNFNRQKSGVFFTP